MDQSAMAMALQWKKQPDFQQKNLVDLPTYTLQTKQLIPRIGPLLLIHDSWGRRSNLVLGYATGWKKTGSCLGSTCGLPIVLEFMHQKHRKFPVNRVNLHLKGQHDIQNSHDCTLWTLKSSSDEVPTEESRYCLFAQHTHTTQIDFHLKRNNAKSVNVCQWSVRIIENPSRVHFMKGSNGNKTSTCSKNHHAFTWKLDLDRLIDPSIGSKQKLQLAFPAANCFVAAAKATKKMRKDQPAELQRLNKPCSCGTNAHT